MICDTFRVQLEDAREVVAKHCPYDPRIEADGLAALQAAGAPVPQVLGCARADGQEEGGVLVLEYVRGPAPKDADWARLGEALADLHRLSAAEAQESSPGYGWPRNNRIGSLVQDNSPPPEAQDMNAWGAFYAERRVRAHLEDATIPGDLTRRLHMACDGPLPDLLGHNPPASLIHGDLWSGNVVDGRWLIDPAVHQADRELELAFMALFGGFPEQLWRAYRDAWPLSQGWRERRPALQLHHLLVHVRHFEQRGPGSYVRAVRNRLDHYGW
jgi:fructosamine-3-kinase